jgi:hypothetical protein
MKTTIDLPDELLISAKKRAAEQRRSLRSLLVEALRNQLSRNAPRTGKKPRIPWDKITVDAGLPPGLDVSNREAMYEWFDRHP